MTGVNLPSPAPSLSLTTTASPSSKKYYSPCEVNDDVVDIEMTTSTKSSTIPSAMNGNAENGALHIPIDDNDDDDGNEDEEEDTYYRGGNNPSATRLSTVSTLVIKAIQSIKEEIVASAEILFSSKITILLLFAPIALVGDATSWIAPSLCFVFAAGALIPCAERYVLPKSSYCDALAVLNFICRFFLKTTYFLNSILLSFYFETSQTVICY
jgi:hypothetical protein